MLGKTLQKHLKCKQNLLTPHTVQAHHSSTTSLITFPMKSEWKPSKTLAFVQARAKPNP